MNDMDTLRTLQLLTGRTVEVTDEQWELLRDAVMTIAKAWVSLSDETKDAVRKFSELQELPRVVEREAQTPADHQAELDAWGAKP